MVNFVTVASLLCAGTLAASDSEVVFRELGRKQVSVGDHVITYVRVLPPKPQVVQSAPASTPSAEEVAFAKRRESKRAELLFFSATVYPGPVTELRWRHDDREFVAYSNVDFRHLSQTPEIETDTTVFSLMGMISVLDGEVTPSPLPAGAAFSGTSAEYLVDCTESEMAANEPAFAALDAIHSFYEGNRGNLIAAAARRETEQAAKERAELEHPVKRSDPVIRFWKIDQPK